MKVSYLREHLSFDQSGIVMEADDKDGKNLHLKGIAIQGGIRNANQRVYPVDEIERAVKTLNDQIQNGYSVLGEVDHPDDLKINLDRVSHMITSMWMDGANGFGKLKILPTPMGKIAEALLNSGVTLGVSSRGIGSVTRNRDGYNEVGDDFMLATAADIVADPSAPDAFVSGIMEGKEWVWEGGILREQLAERTQKRINTLVDQRRLEEHKLNLFNEFLSNL